VLPSRQLICGALTQPTITQDSCYDSPNLITLQARSPSGCAEDQLSVETGLLGFARGLGGYVLARAGAPPPRLWEELELLIGLIAPPWLPVPPRRYGGIEMVIDVLARGLMAAGHQVLLATPAGSSCPVPQVDGLPTSEPERMGHTVVEIPYTLSAYAALKGVDVVHDHTVAGPLCVLPPRGAPVVTTNHGPFNADLNPIYAEMSRQGVAIVAISHHRASTARNVKIATVIHHGIDIDSIPVGDGAGGYACTLGRMTPAKGIREAILVAREAAVPLRIGAKMREPLERQYFDACVRPLLGGDIEYVGTPRRNTSCWAAHSRCSIPFNGRSHLAW
jgi:Glycosyltransferase Family 4